MSDWKCAIPLIGHSGLILLRHILRQHIFCCTSGGHDMIDYMIVWEWQNSYIKVYLNKSDVNIYELKYIEFIKMYGWRV